MTLSSVLSGLDFWSAGDDWLYADNENLGFSSGDDETTVINYFSDLYSTSRRLLRCSIS